MGVRILVDGPEAASLEAAVRAALGVRPAWETWIIALVKQRPRWHLTVLVSPEDRLGEWSFVGPAGMLGLALKDAVREVGLETPERRIHSDGQGGTDERSTPPRAFALPPKSLARE